MAFGTFASRFHFLKKVVVYKTYNNFSDTKKKKLLRKLLENNFYKNLLHKQSQILYQQLFIFVVYNKVKALTPPMDGRCLKYGTFSGREITNNLILLIFRLCATLQGNMHNFIKLTITNVSENEALNILLCFESIFYM